MPGRKVTILNGPVRGYSTYTRFVLDTYSQQVLVFRAQGLDPAGSPVQGYYFEVSGSGSSGSGRAANVRMFETLLSGLQEPWKAVPVREVTTIPYSQPATWDPSSAGGLPAPPTAKQSQEEIVSTIEKLRELRDRGTITEVEFQSKKAELLKRL